MQAIHTKFIAPTNTKCARIKASCASGSITIDYPHELEGQSAFRAAAVALQNKLIQDHGRSWSGELLGGCLPDGRYCFVFNNDRARD